MGDPSRPGHGYKLFSSYPQSAPTIVSPNLIDKKIIEFADSLPYLTSEDREWWHKLNTPDQIATFNKSPHSTENFWHPPPRLSITTSMPEGFPAPKPVREVVVWDRKKHHVPRQTKKKNFSKGDTVCIKSHPAHT